ncbi:MAG: hypothetical protein HYT38_01910 [Candidatus Sungbacteria bacterium]|uniref:Uncharacterized protein n=1 Tax=Candidatus Sungiibacteriota bacterium TaxID=2750080 RepID=A0A9D6DQY4_9BACT|nr:hypothetical protein [Candidatus Sungbacteria bacterium]
MPFKASVFTYTPEHASECLLAVPIRCLRHKTSFATAAQVVFSFNNQRWSYDGEFWLVEPGGEFAAMEEADE